MGTEVCNRTSEWTWDGLTGFYRVPADLHAVFVGKNLSAKDPGPERVRALTLHDTGRSTEMPAIVAIYIVVPQASRQLIASPQRAEISDPLCCTVIAHCGQRQGNPG